MAHFKVGDLAKFRSFNGKTYIVAVKCVWHTTNRKICQICFMHDNSPFDDLTVAMENLEICE